MKTIKFIKLEKLIKLKWAKQIKEVNKNKMELHKKFTLAIIVFLIFMLGGILIYSSIEDWRYIDSAYFTVATVTTIGYGDVVPQTDMGKIFTMFFSFLGIAMAFYFFTLFGKYIYKKTFESKLKEHHDKIMEHLERRSGKIINTRGNK